MASFSAALLRGVVALFAGVLLAGGTLTLAADTVREDKPTLVSAAPEPTDVVVPDVRGQAYVFVKGILQDHWFAWQVDGPVEGYAGNTVATQRPASGTVVVDTGAPKVTLTLARNPGYAERGTPDNTSPYNGTAIEFSPRVPPGA